MTAKSEKPYLIEMPRFCDPRGNLSFAQDNDQVPFAIRHVSWVYDMPADSIMSPIEVDDRELVIVPLSGSFEISVQSSTGDTINHHLNRAYIGLYIPVKSKVTLKNFSTNSVAMILSSTLNPANDD